VSQRPTAISELGRRGTGARLDALLAELSECTASIQALIPEVQAAVDRSGGAITRSSREPPHIIYGGGPSALETREREPQSEAPKAGRRSASDLFVAVELALAGHSRDDIAAYLHARRGPGARRVVAEAFDLRED
jgi:hypothetical protein